MQCKTQVTTNKHFLRMSSACWYSNGMFREARRWSEHWPGFSTHRWRKSWDLNSFLRQKKEYWRFVLHSLVMTAFTGYSVEHQPSSLKVFGSCSSLDNNVLCGKKCSALECNIAYTMFSITFGIHIPSVKHLVTLTVTLWPPPQMSLANIAVWLLLHVHIHKVYLL